MPKPGDSNINGDDYEVANREGFLKILDTLLVLYCEDIGIFSYEIDEGLRKKLRLRLRLKRCN